MGTDTRPANRQGELAAEAFRLFNEGRGFRDVVVALRQPPEVVRGLYREWQEDGDLWLTRQAVDWIRQWFEARFPDERRLLRLRRGYDLVELLEREQEYLDEAEREVDRRQRCIEELESMNIKLRARLSKLQAAPTGETGSAATTERLDERPAPTSQHSPPS